MFATFGDTLVTQLSPTTDSQTVISNAVPGAATPQNALLTDQGVFVNDGTILANGPAGSTFTIAIAPLVTNAATIPGLFADYGRIDVLTGNALLVTGGTLASVGAFAVQGGTAVINSALAPTTANNFTIGGNGTLEFVQPTFNAAIGFAGPGLLKIDQPAGFQGQVNNLRAGGTIDLGILNIATIAYDGNGNMAAIGAGGATLFTAGGTSGAIGNSGSATFALGPTGGTAGNILVTQGSGDTLLTVLPPSVWQWKLPVQGNAGAPQNWSLVSGPGNGFAQPSTDDTVIVPFGNVATGLDSTLQGITIAAGGTAATTAIVNFSALIQDNKLSLANPTLDSATLFKTAVPGQTTPETTILNTAGIFINEGTILANGPAGSTLTINAGPTLFGTATSPGYFFNAGTIQANAGNTVVLNIGSNTALFNSGTVIANGGTIRETFAPAAIAGGDMPVRGFDLIQGGGMIETASGYPASIGNNGNRPRYIFSDTTPGNTLKIDNVGSFAGSIVNFSAGDTVDLGTLLPVASLTYDASTGLTSLQNATGTVLASLLLGNPGIANGTFAVSGGIANGFTIGTSATGSTVLTTGRALLTSTNASGTWQSAASWNGGTVPGTATPSPVIGLGASAPFTLTTGAAPVSAQNINVESALATFSITSNTTLATAGFPASINDYAGTVVIAAGATLTAGAIQLERPQSSFTIAAGATAALAGRININLEPTAGVYALQPGGNFYGLGVAAGSAEIDGTLLAGPTATTRGGLTAIGYAGSGAAIVTVNPGAVVTDSRILLGSAPTSTGTLIINGATWSDIIDTQDTFNSRGNITVGNNDLASDIPAGTAQPVQAGPAVLVIENYGTLTDQVSGSIGPSTNSAGSVLVQSGGFWNIAVNNTGFLNVGGLGTGALTILGNGTVAVGATGTFLSNGTSFTGGGIRLGNNAGGTGTVTVYGQGALLTTAGGAFIGQSGQGLLSIGNGGTVAVTAGSVIVAQNAGSVTGTIAVGGQGSPAALNLSAGATSLTLGNASGDRGILTVTDNGTVNLNGTGNLTIGNVAGASGAVTIGGATAAAVVNLAASRLIIGNSGSGNVTVNALGTLNANGSLNTGIIIGQNAGASGTLTVNGGLVTEGTSSIGLTIGLNTGASGTVAIQAGGTFAITGNSGATIGNATGSSGTVTVTGAGSRLLTTGANAITVGNSGTGILAVSASASVTDASALSIGANTGSNGTATVNNAALSASSLTVGNFGAGTLAITNGTVATSGILAIGVSSGGSGAVTLAGGTLSATGGIQVGLSGTGTLAVTAGSVTAGNLAIGGSFTAPLSATTDKAVLTAGANLQVTNNLAIWSTGTISIDATSAIDIGTSGTYVAGAINIEAGHNLTGDGTIAANVINAGLIAALGTTAANIFTAGTLDIQGNVTGTGTISIANNAIVRIDGSLAATQTISFAPGAAGELILTNPGTALANAITGLATGDKIEFGNGTTITSVAAVNGNTITVGFLGATGIASTYNLTNVTYAPGAAPLFAFNTDFSTGFAYLQVQPSAYNWAGTGGTDYATGANWQGGLGPTTAGTVNFFNNPGTVTGFGGALSLNIGGNPGTWTFNNTTLTVAGSPSLPNLPFAAGFNQNTVLNGGILNAVGGATSIGNGATVTAQNGAKVTTLGDSVGTNSSQSGSLYLTGLGTNWTQQTGTAINGSTPGYLTIGFNGPGNGQAGSAGFLTVTNSATLATGSFAQFAGNAGSYGTGTVAAGALWTIGTGLYVGNGGSGNLLVSGGTVTDSGFATIGNLGGQSTLTVANGGLFTTNANLTAGAQLGAFGNIVLNSGSINAATGLQIGASGQGLLQVTGGTLTFGGTFNPIGANAGGIGALQVTGGTVKSNQAPGTAQILQIGNAGSSGNLAAASGNVLVSGATALLDLNTNGLSVGSAGSGSLTVAAGGTVNAGVTNANLGTGLSAANQSGGQAAITVTGTASALNLSGNLTLGQLGYGTLTVANSGLLKIQNAATNGAGLWIGAGFSTPSNSGGLAEATVASGGIINDANILNLGGNGASGILNVNSGGTVLLGSGLTNATALSIGNATKNLGTVYGGTGSLNINAGGTVLITEAAQTNTFAVVIGNANSSVGQSTGNAEGNVVVSGAGALLSTNNNAMLVGGNAVGNLTISQGGSVTAGTSNSNLIGALFIGRFSTGSVLLTDTGSSLNVTGLSVVGRAGSGSLLIQNNAVMNVAADPTGSGGIAIGGGQNANNTVQTSAQTGGSGIAQVTTGGTLFAQAGIFVGRNGASGVLSVNTGGVVESGTTIRLGQTETISAGGSIVTATGTTIVAGVTLLNEAGVINVGPSGLLKADGTGLAAGNAAIVIGDGTGSSGALNVSGAGATATSNGYRITVGSTGTGSLLISQGGTVLAGTQFTNDQALVAGGSAAGAVTLTDAGSRLLASGQFVVGLSAQGSLLIQNQATAVTGGNVNDAAQGFEVGLNAASSGIATITGTQSALTNTGRFVIGDAGLGSLNINAGGTVATSPGTSGLAAAVIANTAGASGSAVNVAGTGSNWQVAGNLIVGNQGYGNLAIAQGGSVAATALTLGAATGGTGILSVVGPASALALTGNLTVGSLSTGELTILSGATVSAASATIGGTGSLGASSVDIEGAGSRLNLTGSLTVGLTGPAVFTLGQNTHLLATGNVFTGASGIFNQSGTIDPAFIINDGQTNLGNGAADLADTAIQNSGTFTVTNGTATLYTPSVTSDPASGPKGLWQIGTAGTLVVNATTVDASQTFDFTAGNATLVIGQVPDAPGGIIAGTVSPGAASVLSGFAGLIQNYQSGDQIAFNGLTIGSDTISGNVVTLWSGANGTGTNLGSLSFVNLAGAADPTGAGLAATQLVQCFAAGTKIRTDKGDTAVEDLREGDQAYSVLTNRHVPIKWIGHRHIDCTSHPRPETVHPVRIAAHAFGPGTPARDVLLSPDHAVYVEDVLVPVRYLINGTTIRQIPRAEVTYFHIELAHHDVLLADNLPAESYLDTGTRQNFANGGPVVALHPDFAAPTTVGDIWETQGCAPLVLTGATLASVRNKLAAAA